MQDKPVFLTIIGFRSPLEVNAEAVSAILKAQDPARSYELIRVPTSEKSTDAGLIVNVEGVQFTVLPRAGKAVTQSLSSAVRAAALTWKHAGEAVGMVDSQIIVAANQPAGDHSAAIKIAYLLTALTAAVAALGEPSFVYWGTADLLVEPSAFVSAAEEMLRRNQPPILQWVRFELIRGPDTSGGATGGMRSRGMAPFVGHELQLEPISMPPTEIARRTIGYAEHLLREGPSDTSEIPGPDPQERITLTRTTTDHGTLVHLKSQRDTSKQDREGGR